MLIYALQRIGLAMLICVVAMTVLFSIAYVIPGDPASITLGPRATPEMREALRERMGLDQPLPIQLVNFFGNVLTGDLGVDVWSKRPVTTIVFDALPYTLALAAAGLGWAILLGIPLGCYSAIRRNTLIDKLTGVISVGAISVPSFVVAIYGILIFAVGLRWLPALGAGAEGDLLDQLWHLILPAFAIGLGWVGYLARLVRASMLEVMSENHVRTARAFGLPERMIVFRYALRIAVLPTVTLLGIAYGGLLSNAVFVEFVFNRPGIGQLAVAAVNTRNYPVMMGATLTTVFLFAICTMIADLIVALLDPRVRASL
ncbi:ABC transporter permease [Rhodospirillaceae bacterium SYSU D60014]|uniref:ABC transporter permease n=1 Tax=Virgifigura deserti TaxID=2268457 RepID=UPI000E671EBD